MNLELPEKIYLKKDIDRAFNWGLQTALTIFEETLGLPYGKQKIILDRMKEKLVEDKVASVMSRS